MFPWFTTEQAEAHGPDHYPLHAGDPCPEAHRLLGGYLMGAVARRTLAPEQTEAGAALLALDDEAMAEATVATLVRWAWNLRGERRGLFVQPLRTLGNRLLRRRLALGAERLGAIFSATASLGAERAHDMPLRGLLRQAEWSVEDGEVPEALRAGLKALAGVMAHHRAEDRALLRRIEELLGDGPEGPAGLEPGEWWSDQALSELEAMGAQERGAWVRLLWHARGLSAGRPSERWRHKAARLLEEVGAESFRQRFEQWVPRVGRAAPGAGHRGAPSDGNAEVLRGLAWVAAQVPSESVARALGDLAEVSYRKATDGSGPRALRVGNACLEALGSMGWAGISRLVWLRQRIKHAAGLTRLQRALDDEAERRGASVADIEELAVPDCGLGQDGRLEIGVGCGFKARIEVPGPLEARLVWVQPGGKPQKSTPAAIKRAHPEQVARVQGVLRELQLVLPAQRDRLESLWLGDRCWSWPQWRARYLEHPLLARLARGLVWQFRRGPRAAAGVWRAGRVVDADNRPLRWLDDRTMVHLWHPAEADPEERVAWQRWLIEQGVTQPFKQAHRELYDAAQVTLGQGVALRQHQLAALCKQRGWRFSLLGPAFGQPTPATLPIPRWGLVAELPLRPCPQRRAVATSGAWLSLQAGAVVFRQVDGDGEPTGVCPPHRVPASVRSEVLRDVDLFISVCAEDAGHSRADASLSTRRGALFTLLARTPLAPRVRVEADAVIVRGVDRRCRIDLQSAEVTDLGDGTAVHVEAPGECPVPLPFEGDRTMEQIVARAWALAGLAIQEEHEEPPSPEGAIQGTLALF